MNRKLYFTLCWRSNLVSLRVTSDEEMVGFILFDNEAYTDGYYWILRFMIDGRYQGQGYGKSGLHHEY
ncbi:GNAT family N-acetyltransferase [Paenibacillus sp. FSL H8-0048]|uniref:GNAT family N-acetyltransferase n=1 Tax=Paenibacillus sp. FSL H8-0048 TaxID=2954508 RepID=UPI0030F6EC99